MDYKEIIYERRGPVAVITFNRPTAMNAISMRMLDEFMDAIQVMRSDPTLVVAVITGAGRAFMAGADLKEVSRYTREESKVYNDRIISSFSQIEQLDIPVIAAINGFAFGGGMELTLACTMRFAAQSAKMALTEVKLGIMPGAGGTQRLPRLIQRSKALRILLTGDTLTADEACRLGVVDEVVPDEELLDFCLALAERIGANAPLSVKGIKNAVTTGADMPLAQALAYTDRILSTLAFSPDALEGPTAFAQKRKPKFIGRYYNKEELS